MEKSAPAQTTSKTAGLQNRSLLLMLGMIAVTAGFALPALMTGKVQLPDLGAPAESAATKSSIDYVPPAKPEASSSGMLLLRLVIGTVLVTGLSVGILWSARRWLTAGPTSARGGNQLQLLETLPLNYRCSMHLLQVGTCQVLAAVDGTGIKTVIALPEPFESTLRGVQAQELPFKERTDEVIVPMTKRVVRAER